MSLSHRQRVSAMAWPCLPGSATMRYRRHHHRLLESPRPPPREPVQVSCASTVILSLAGLWVACRPRLVARMAGEGRISGRETLSGSSCSFGRRPLACWLPYCGAEQPLAGRQSCHVTEDPEGVHGVDVIVAVDVTECGGAGDADVVARLHLANG